MSMSQNRNPWLGLATYEEESVCGSSPYIFCGRDKDIDGVYSYVENNILITLYGKSGVGKSSLLQAGIFPRLRANNYFPVLVRLGVDDNASDYSTIVVARLNEELKKHGCMSVVYDESVSLSNASDESYLWYYFHSRRFYGKNQQIIYPVIVVDQFEELFFLHRDRLDLFLKQLYLLLDDSSLGVEDIESADVTNYRIIVALREDDLFRLEDTVDRLRLVEMKHSRYRLTEMNWDSARMVVSEPGYGLFYENEMDEVVDIIVKESVGEDGLISTAVLSLLCNMFYEKTIGIGRKKMSLHAVHYFMEGSKGNYLSSFYEDIKVRLGDPAKWYYIEDNLITDDGRRKFVLKSEFIKNVPDSEFLFQERTAMLRYVTTSSKREKNVEIIHDLLARQLLNSKEDRKIKEKSVRLRRIIYAIAAVVLCLIAIIGKISNANNNLKEAYYDMQIIQSRYLASEARISIDHGDLDRATKLLLYALPAELNAPDRPYTLEAEAAMHDVYQLRNPVDTIKSRSSVDVAVFSEDGKQIYVFGKGETLTRNIYDAETLTHMDDAPKAFGIARKYFFHDKSRDGNFVMERRDVDKNEYAGSFRDVRFVDGISYWYGNSSNVVFSNDSKKCLINYGNHIESFELFKGYTRSHIILGHDESRTINTAVFSPCGNYILYATSDSNAYVTTIASDNPILVLPHGASVNSAAFSPDGHKIVTTSADRKVLVWKFVPLSEQLDSYNADRGHWELSKADKDKYHLQ